jgi:mRNA interferase MazF
MKRPGTVALLRFPQGESELRKRRPVLLVAPVPGRDSAWLVCALSTHTHQAVKGFDEIIDSDDPDFESTGLKIPSVIRIGRLAVVASQLLEGSIGEIGDDRLKRIRARLQRWIGTGD